MAQYWATILNNTPRNYYRLGDLFGTSAFDSGTTGQTYDGTITGGPVLNQQPGAIANDPDGCMSFNGSSQYVSLPLAQMTAFTWNTFSIECWFYLAVSPTGFWRIVACADTLNDNKGFELLVNSGGTGVQFHVGNGSAHASAQKSITLSTGTWYHIVGTWDGLSSNTAKVYVNAGVGGTTGSLGGSLGTVTHGCAIGYNPAYSGDYFDGYIDEVAFYPSVLTQAQITNHYNVGQNSTIGPWTCTVQRVPYLIENGSLSIDWAVNRPSTAMAVLHHSTSTHFQQYQQVRLYDTKGVLAFSGYINQPRETKPGFQNMLSTRITCMDQTWLALKRVVRNTSNNLELIYIGKPYDYIVQDIVTQFLSAEGVTVGQIYGGPYPSTSLYPSTVLYPSGPTVLIPSATFKFPTVQQALDAIAKASASTGVNFYVYFDQYKRLYFLVYTATTGPTVDGSTIDQGGRKPPYVIRQNPLYYNTQYIAGGTDNGLADFDYIVADGNTTTWTLPLGPITTAPSIWVNGSAVSVGQLNIDSGKAFYWTKNSAQISASSTYAKDTGITVIYNPQVPTTASEQNSTEVANQAAIDGSSGIVESVIKDTSINSLAYGLAEASANLARNAQRGTQFVFTTRDTTFAAGQQITVNYSPFNFSGTTMLVENLHMDDSDGLNIWYTVTAVVGPVDSTWVQFFGGALTSPPAQQAQSINIGV